MYKYRDRSMSCQKKEEDRKKSGRMTRERWMSSNRREEGRKK